MNSINYRPEGTSALDEKPSLLQLERAKATNRILEARAVMCDNDHKRGSKCLACRKKYC